MSKLYLDCGDGHSPVMQPCSVVQCRYLLLTPFLPNATDLSEWLGDGDGVAISLNWKPSEQIRAIGKWAKRKGRFYNELQLVPSASQSQALAGRSILLGDVDNEIKTRSRPQISSTTAAHLAHEGGVLILTRGPGTAEKRAAQIAEEMQGTFAAPDDPLVTAAGEYIRSELARIPHG